MDDVGRVDEQSWFFVNIVKRRVFFGYLMAVLFLVVADPSRLSVIAGFVIALVGEAIRTWSSGILVKNEELTTTGPYALVRNPLYVGNFAVGLGVAVMGGSLLLVILFPLFFLPVYTMLIRKEEKRLLDRYGDAFLDYCRRVPRLMPNLAAWPPQPAPYDGRRMFYVHREWKAWLGIYGITMCLLYFSA